MKPTLTLSLIAAFALAGCSRADVTPLAHAAAETPPRDAAAPALPQYPPLQPNAGESPAFDPYQY